MGVEITHLGFWSYSSLYHWQVAVLKLANVESHVAAQNKDREPLGWILTTIDDVQGHIPAERCKPLADRLKGLLLNLTNDTEEGSGDDGKGISVRERTESWIAALHRAHDSGTGIDIR